MTDNDNMTVVLTGRLITYKVLHVLLGNEPTPEALQMLTSAETKEILALFSQGSEEYRVALKKLQDAANNRPREENAFIDSLSVDYTRLFIGPGMVEVSPWESVYRNTDRALFQASTLEVRKAYVKQDLIPSGYPNVADDHIGIELDFMAKLAERVVESNARGNMPAVREALAASKEFLDEHLLEWVPKFVDTFNDTPHGSFYGKVAELLLSFIKIDREILVEIEEALSQ
jgi:TorA maturation chaperone TorD